MRALLPAAVVATLLLVPAAVPAAFPALPDARPAAATAQDVGAWGTPFDGQVPAVSMALLRDGRVLYWSGVEAAHEHDQDMTFFLSHPHQAEWAIVDFSSGSPVVSRPPGGTGSDLFCAGHTILPDGRVLAAGGTNYTTIPEAGAWDILYGAADARVFDPATDSWSMVDYMENGRWYPSVITLQNGDALVASGISTLTQPFTMVEQLERYDAVSDQWRNESSHLLPMYPRLSVVPSGGLKGLVHYSTNGALWGPFGEHPLEAPWSLQQVMDRNGQWHILQPSLLGARQHAATVMLPLDPADGHRAKLLTFGGTLQRSIAAVPFAEVEDLGTMTEPARNALAAPMHQPRWHLNGVNLPDGTVLAVGGGAYDNVVIHGQPNFPALTAEIYDPATNTWTETGPMQVPRMYHSTALLLADGRVLVGGHVPLPVPFKAARDDPTLSSTPFSQAQVQEKRLEVYSPPYLFRGPRPVIASAPAQVGYGATFTVQMGSADPVVGASFIKPGATTHSFDADQRMVELQVLGQVGSTLTLRAPPDPDVATPGHHMLFVNGGTPAEPVPSVAKFVRLG